GSFLESPAPEFVPTVIPPTAAESPGTVIGPYKLLEQIGEGGFGIVYMADQQAPVRRRVALKIIKPGMDTKQVLARFRAELQALSLMDHPNIARALDAGATDSGRPYFVMELVKGIPITEYSDECHLTTEDRLTLFVAVCEAVQHAHQKGIIHRDIKPSNVLIAMQDGQPTPKVIDFGVAKAINQQLTQETIFTRFAEMIGTPLYMSPEQAEMSPLEVDTRSDTYSLGVLLYELLTGTTPFSKERLNDANYDELRRIICDEEPPKPSDRISTLGALATTVAEHRRVDPRKLTQLVRGDLDWIVMKALEKDRTRRYQTASAFAADIERHVRDEVVEARPPSAAYKFRKFARRNRAWLATAAAVLLTVIVGLSVSTVLISQERDAAQAAAERERDAAEQANRQRTEAERERQRAETNLRMAREAVDKLFTNVAQQLANKPHMEQIRRRLLEDALEFYQGFLKQKGTDPEMRHETARAYWRVGGIQETLGNGPQAEGALRQAVALLDQLAAEFPTVPAYREDLALSREDLAYRLYWANKHEEHAELRRLDLADWEKLAADFPTVPHYQQRLAHAHTDLGNALKDSLGRLPEAEQHHRLALTTWKKFQANFPKTSEDRFGLSHSHFWLGVLLLHTDRLPEAEAELRQALGLREQLVAEAPDAPGRKSNLAHVQAYVGDLLARTGKPHDAAQYYQRAIDIQEKQRDHFPDNKDEQRRLGIEYRQLSGALRAWGRTQEAEDAIRRSLEIRQKLIADHPGVEPHAIDLGRSYFDLGLLLHDTRRPQEAAEAFRQARELFEMVAKEFPDVADPQFALAWLLATCPAPQFRDPDRAVEAAQRHLQHFTSSRKGWHVLGIAQYRAGKWQAAVEALAKAMELGQGGDSSEWFFLAMAQWQLGQKDEARKRYDQAVAWMDKNRPGDQDLRRFRAEAAELLGVKQPPAPEAKQEDKPATEKTKS
ncbi:MAG: protein kinase, partial [Actinomycetota bacterium]